MVEPLQEFNSKSITRACEFLTSYCDTYINTAAPSKQHARMLYCSLPGMITTIFGGPSARGWVHIELSAEQATAIRITLRYDGPFMKALLQLSGMSDLKYDVDTDKLAEDVRKALAAGAVECLPRVYINCTHFDKRDGTGLSDIRISATKQSTIFPRSISGEHKVQFNAIQFFLYYAVLIPFSITSSASSTLYTRPSSTLVSSSANSSTTMMPASSSNSFANVRPSSVASSTSALSSQQRQAPRPRSIIGSVYEQLMDEYIRCFIACEPGAGFHPLVGRFFLDACIELWIRTPHIAFGQKLNQEQMHFISLFVKYIVSCDLRRVHKDTPNHYRTVYDSVRTELYGLISRLALNWSKDDDYVQVISLWALWTAPWRFGKTPKTVESNDYRPITELWSYHIMENGLFYFSLAEVFLQRMATFTYPDKPPPVQQYSHFHVSPTTAAPTAATTPKSGGQLRITWRFINIFKPQGMVEFLGDVERGLVQQGDSTTSSNQAVETLATKYLNNQKDLVQANLKMTYDDLVRLGGGTWQPPNLYIKEKGPRAAPLQQSLDALDQATLPQDTTPRPWGPATGARSPQFVTEIDSASKTFAAIFSLPKPSRKKQTTSRSIFSTLQKTPSRAPARKKEIPMAGLLNDGFLTGEERELVRRGRMQCSHKNIPIVGPRGEEVVKSYELTFMVRYIIPFDRWMNKHYNRWRPNYAFLPEKLTLRPLADVVNVVYLVAGLLLLVILLWTAKG